MDDMYRVIPKISENIIGATIEGIVAISLEHYSYPPSKEDEGNTLDDAYCPHSEIIIKLNNGKYLKCWNSECGGIEIVDKNNEYESIINEGNK